jgi:serine/threonine-protein kinase PknG
MADQLYGVLREIVAEQEGRAVAAPSNLFSSPQRGERDQPDWHALPRPTVDTDDPAAGYLATISAGEPRQLIAQLSAAPDRTVEVELRHAAALIELGELGAAEDLLVAVEAADRWEWRAAWYRGVAELARGRPDLAHATFTRVYRSLPGELAPKQALGLACEVAGEWREAARWYDILSRTDPGFTSATFGLARCLLATHDRSGALDAYERVPETSSAYVEAQTARIHCLAVPNRESEVRADELLLAGTILESLPVAGEQRARLQAELFEAALGLVERGLALDDGRPSLLGHRFLEQDLRLAAERSYRELARLTSRSSDRIALVDRANQIRPRTWI